MAAPAADRRHEHRWRGVEFYLEDDHPYLLQSCECGETRAHKAWERYWDPSTRPLLPPGCPSCPSRRPEIDWS